MAEISLLMIVCIALLQASSWVDPARHRIEMVTVANGVRLEVLDFGGNGRPIVLLAGAGNTAHVLTTLRRGSWASDMCSPSLGVGTVRRREPSQAMTPRGWARMSSRCWNTCRPVSRCSLAIQSLARN
jgi:hypothetical protein